MAASIAWSAAKITRVTPVTTRAEPAHPAARCAATSASPLLPNFRLRRDRSGLSPRASGRAARACAYRAFRSLNHLRRITRPGRGRERPVIFLLLLVGLQRICLSPRNAGALRPLIVRRRQFPGKIDGCGQLGAGVWRGSEGHAEELFWGREDQTCGWPCLTRRLRRLSEHMRPQKEDEGRRSRENPTGSPTSVHGFFLCIRVRVSPSSTRRGRDSTARADDRRVASVGSASRSSRVTC
jgi:hypothetical protein